MLGETRDICDGKLEMKERNSSNVPLVSYTRGADLSGTFEGAGGIGGLLARSDQYSGGNWGRALYYHADGNGNVTYLMMSDQTMAATYRYDPYGRPLSSSGTFASANTMRFSSKLVHPASSLYYYGYRFYWPDLQRWVNRDPVGEEGAMNLYEAFRNSPGDYFDAFGLDPGDWYSSVDSAAISALCDIYARSRAEKTEYGGLVYYDPAGFYSYTDAVRGTEVSVPCLRARKKVPKGCAVVAAYHSHTSGEDFTSEDRRISIKLKLRCYMIGPSHVMKCFDDRALPPDKVRIIGGER